MPPKKKIKIDPNQRKLSFSPSNFEDVDKNNNALVELDNKNNTSTVTEGQNKVRREFRQKWLGNYSWLRYVETSNDKPDYMYCNICEQHNVKNGMCKAAQNRNFQNSTLTRHADLPEHRKFIVAPALQSDFASACKKVVAEQDKAIIAMIRILHWIVQEDLPLTKFKPLVGLMNSFNVEDIELLNKSKINYQSPVAVNDLLDCLAEFAQNNVNKKLNSSEYVTVLTDESTDICNNKRQVIYAQVLNDKFCPETLYVTNVECCNATGVGIAHAVLDEMMKRGVSAKQIMSLGSDGASAMTGKEKGAAAIMRRSNPHMHNVHCVAHKLALCTSQAAEKVPMIKKHQQILTDLYYYFKGSGKREARLHSIQEVLDDPILTVKEIHSVRWLSYFNALTAVWRTLDSLFTYLAEASVQDPKALGLKKKIATYSFIGTSYMLMDSMAPLTVLSQFFQTENVDVALVKVKLEQCMDELQEVREMKSPYLLKLKEDLTNNHFRGHEVVTSNFDLKKTTEAFVDNVSRD
ncbi:E3 SUMO-protein ligase KIAA1586-like isoform X2 [Ruditapes philippinarum]|uniref:E3 SUMO-protein ligase KIAA1586-like isoform X2 n=1 Tax=Ruditapes philippinarum TaxID=129788 RepID=UPI00295B587E|nr:E3 SUMO-protein ligase KIAA1586-like isoform X2 [Ruditapes philippinarum]